MITYKKGNLLDTPDDFIVHGCNAQGVMGSGVAKAIRDKYPKAFDDYYKFCVDILYAKYPPPESEYMGKVITSEQPDGKTILNAITQRDYGNDGAKYVSYDAIDDVMRKLGEAFLMSEAISIPKIGAGLGGGQWSVIEQIIAYRLKDNIVTVWELE